MQHPDLWNMLKQVEKIEEQKAEQLLKEKLKEGQMNQLKNMKASVNLDFSDADDLRTSEQKKEEIEKFKA